MSKSSNDQLYCKVCVLANELADYKDSPLEKREVKEIFSNTRNLNFDIEHDHNYLSGVDIQETYINSSNEDLAGAEIPAGSWLMTLRVVNPDIRKSIEEGELTGVSLETNFTDDVQVTDYENERLQYKDVLTKEEMMPVTISFTSKPANMLPMEVMTHQQYTAKHRRYDNLKEDQEDEVTFLRGFVEKLFTNNDDAQTTAKSMEAIPQPQSNNFKYQELIDSLIETQKILPSLTQTVNAISESQVKMTESFNDLSQKIDTAVLTQATETLETGSETSEDTGEDSDEESEPEPETIEAEPETEPEEADQEEAEPEESSEEETEEDESEEEADTETETETDAETDTDEDTDEDGASEDEDEDDPKKQKTAKNIKGANTRRPLTMDNNSTSKNNNSYDYKQFMLNRSYEHLIENANKE